MAKVVAHVKGHKPPMDVGGIQLSGDLTQPRRDLNHRVGGQALRGLFIKKYRKLAQKARDHITLKEEPLELIHRTSQARPTRSSIHDPKEVAGEHNHFDSLFGFNGNMTMAVRVLIGPNGTCKEIRKRLLF